MSAEKPLVYLDQNVLSVMVREEGGWKASEYGRILTSEFPNAEVWISPSHVVELSLHPDAKERSSLASMMLDMTDVRRMAPDYIFEVFEGFLQYLEAGCPNVLRTRAYVDSAANQTSQLFLAALALMATGRQLRSEVIQRLTRQKVESRYLRAEASAEPDAWLDKVEEAAKRLQLVHGDPRPDVTAKSLDVLKAEILAFEDQAVRIKDRNRLIKLAPQIVRAYSVGDVMEALGEIFGKLPGDLFFTFNFENLEGQWPELVKRWGCHPLPTGTDVDSSTWMIAEAAQSLWRARGGVVAADIAQEVIIGHYLERLNERGRERKERLEPERKWDQLPTDSLTFDADHASLALRRTEVFVTHDRNLATIAKRIAKWLATQIKWECAVVSDTKELRDALTRLAARAKKE